MILANTKNYPCEKVTGPSLGLTPSPLGTMSCTIFHLCQVSGETCLNFCYVANMCSQCFISVSIFSCIYISDDTDFLEHALFFMFLFPLPLLRFQFLLFLVFWIVSHLRSQCLPWKGLRLTHPVLFWLSAPNIFSQYLCPWIPPNAKHQLNPPKRGVFNIPYGKDPR